MNLLPTRTKADERKESEKQIRENIEGEDDAGKGNERRVLWHLEEGIEEEEARERKD